ncbi:MAG: thioredoxin domain-containing protein, partial [Acidobacteriota bacterium]
PFYGGGYYRKEAFDRQIRKIADEWRANRDTVLNSAGGVTALLRELSEQAGPDALTDYRELLESSYAFYVKSYDPRGGGFGKAPKFPFPDVFSFLLRYHLRTGKRGPLQMTVQSLKKMAQGGIRDHLAGGFHRYSTDESWIVPRFEKLLFIQAQLAVSYTEAFQLSGEPELGAVAREILDFSLEHLRQGEGGFYSAIDGADACPSDPEKICQGLYYTWSESELKSVLGDDYPLVAFAFGVERGGNIRLEDTRELSGRNVLFRPVSDLPVAERFGIERSRVPATLGRLRDRLLEVRRSRKLPRVDDKQLAGWNGLMISALARAYQAFGETRYLNAAEETAAFAAEHLWDRESGRLRRRYREGAVSGEGFVDDYALLIQGLLDLYESGFSDRWLLLAIDLAEMQLTLFWDEERGGFFNTPGSDERLLVRVKELYDGVEPSPNGVSALNLARLSVLMKDEDLGGKARKAVAAFSDRFERSPKAKPQLKAAMEFLLAKKKQIVIAGAKDDPRTAELVEEVHRRFIPNRVLFLADRGEAHQRLGEKLELLKSVRPIGGQPTAYVCEDYICQFPTSDPARVAELLN